MPLEFPAARGLKDLTVEDVLQLWPKDDWGALLVPRGTDNFYRAARFQNLNEKASEDQMIKMLGLDVGEVEATEFEMRAA